MTNLDSIFKNRDITLPTKFRLVKAMVYPVVMYGCESWTVKKAERWRTDDFELWCWRRLLRVPLTARRFNSSILKISPGCSLEGMMLQLKLQYFGHVMWRADSFEKTLMLEKSFPGGSDCKASAYNVGDLGSILGSWRSPGEGPILLPGKSYGQRSMVGCSPRGRERCWERLKAGEEASLTQWTWVWVNSGVGDGQGGLACCSPWGCKESNTADQLSTAHSLANARALEM